MDYSRTMTDLVYVSLNNKFFYIRVPYYPSVIVYPILPMFYYTEKVDMKVTVANRLNDTAQKSVAEYVNVVNL